MADELDETRAITRSGPLQPCLQLRNEVVVTPNEDPFEFDGPGRDDKNETARPEEHQVLDAVTVAWAAQIGRAHV